MSRFSGVPNKNLTWKPVSPESLDLSGKRVVVVGGTGGIGRALSRLMAARGAQVTIVGRTFREADTPGIRFMQADLELMSEAVRIGENVFSSWREEPVGQINENQCILECYREVKPLHMTLEEYRAAPRPKIDPEDSDVDGTATTYVGYAG